MNSQSHPTNAAEPAPPSPSAEGLFLDVPFILDSLFRWTEFRANRCGVVDVNGRKGFLPRPRWRSPIFGIYVLMTIFLVFGPTFKNLCTLLGPEHFSWLKTAVTTGTLVTTVLAGLYLLAGTLTRLTRRIRSERENFNEQRKIKLPIPGSLRDKLAGLLAQSMPGVLGGGPGGQIEKIWKVWPDFDIQLRRLNARGWRRCAAALFGLLIVIAGALAPLLAVWVAAHFWQLDPDVCERSDHVWRIWAQLATTAVCIAVMGWLWSGRLATQSPKRLAASLLLWATGIGLLWTLVSDSQARETTAGPYWHTYPIVVGVLGLLALVAAWLAEKWLGTSAVWVRQYVNSSGQTVRTDWAAAFRERLKSLDLIQNNRGDPPIERIRIGAAFLNGVGGRPLQALLLPAFVALTFPTASLLMCTSIAAGVGVILLAYGSLSQRWQQLVVYIDRWFLVGTPLPVSVFVIVVGSMRLFDVQYVSTVLDAAPFGTLFIVLMMSYLAAWYFEYWINRWPAEHLLKALGAPNPACNDVIDLPDVPAGVPTYAEPKNRYLGIHGTGRFCAQGWMRRADPALWEESEDSAFNTYGFVELFRALSLAEDDPDVIHGLQRRLQLYFYTMNGLVIAAAFGLWWWHHSFAEPLASAPVIEVNVEAASATGPSNLLTALEVRDGSAEPALIVAASGGGTRAALYTARALEGLATLHRAKDIVLLSGVSGGGVAAAVFADRFASLATPDPVIRDWDAFVRDMEKPFITDVLDGIGELRIAKSTPLGELLVESFSHRLFRDQPRGFRDLHGPLLILNSTVSGHPAEDSQLLDGRAAIPKKTGNVSLDCAERSRPFSSLAGGRVLYTNLSSDAGFPVRPSYPPDLTLDFTVLRPPEDARLPDILLAPAAALNANFPPVFPNARILVRHVNDTGCAQRSYYVTDGGATENLGLVSALYALRGAVTQAAPSSVLRHIHLIAIEASAVTYDYSEDRGIGAATGGAKERINGGLTQELIQSIREMLRIRGHGESLTVHYLPLPLAFRSRGGLGTHWMYARTFRVSNPLVADMPGRFLSFWRSVGGKPLYQMLEQQDIDVLWRGLFAPDARFCTVGLPPPENGSAVPSDRAVLVQNWICGREDAKTHVAKPDYQTEAWKILVGQLDGRTP